MIIDLKRSRPRMIVNVISDDLVFFLKVRNCHDASLKVFVLISILNSARRLYKQNSLVVMSKAGISSCPGLKLQYPFPS